ncbi:MAG: hypothetical protein CL609_16870 [Anaerolineaceae bacterium]|nr:hypothetical protein [Anaerolineaceae bacterium]
MQPTKNLPDTYVLDSTFDLKTNRKLLIGLNVIGLGLMVLFTWLFWQMVVWQRPEMNGSFSFSIKSIGSLLWGVVGFIFSMFLVLVLHEIVHGFFFWVFTKNRPLFGFKGAYAYAAAPDWYFPHGKYLVIGLAPLVVISLAGILLMPVFPLQWMWMLLVALVLNASGAVGDLAVCAWLLLKRNPLLIRDFGDVIHIYAVESTPAAEV